MNHQRTGWGQAARVSQLLLNPVVSLHVSNARVNLYQAGNQQPGSQARKLAERHLPKGTSVGWREQSRWLTGPLGAGFGHLTGDAGWGGGHSEGKRLYLTRNCLLAHQASETGPACSETRDLSCISCTHDALSATLLLLL